MDRERFEGRRVGVIGDTHDDFVDWPAVQPKIEEAFDGVDLILHCGDLTSPGMLEAMEKIAPVRAVRSTADPDASPPRLVDGPVLFDTGEMRFVLVRLAGEDGVLSIPAGAEDASVVVHGATHAASIDERDGVLFVNPGSPTLAERTTVALLELDGPHAQARIVDV